ncbi:hypothetical protein AB1E18_006307 [Capra hircus]
MLEIREPGEIYPDLSALLEAADGCKGPLLVPKFRFLVESSRSSIQVWPSQRLLLELLIGRRRYYANQGESRPIKVPAVEFGTTFIHCTTMPTDTEMDMSEFMRLTKEKDTSESMMPTDKEIDMSGANSKACVDGLQAQKECQELNKHLQRQLNQPQEVLHEKEAEAATCKQTVPLTQATLRDALKKEQARVEELQGELATLNQQVDDLSEKLRRKSEDSAEDYASSFFDLFLVSCGVVTTPVVFISCKCLKK